MISSEELASKVSKEALAALGRAYRGCALYVPTTEIRSKTYNHLVETIGIEETVQLIRSFGGKSFYFKKGTSEDTQRRHAEIAEQYQGQRVKDFAVEVGYSAQQVYRILVKAGKLIGRELPEGKALRNRQIYEDSERLTVKQLSEKYSLSASYIQYVLSNFRQPHDKKPSKKRG